MSRCFPFPPPGYEKKQRVTEQGDLLAKEKHKEKKHKKGKDREKGEGRERKDKDRNKDKHKEKKERKEKHNDKNKDKEKNKLSEDRRNEHGSEVHREDRLPYEGHKTEEVRNSKFTEELGRRIRDEEQGAKNHMVEDLSATTHRRIQTTGASPVTGTDKMVTEAMGTLQRKNEKLPPSYHQRTDGMEIATNTEKQKAAISEKNPEFSAERRTKENLMQQKRNGSMEKQRAAIIEHPGLVQRKTESIYTVNSMQKERATSNNMVSNTIGSATKTEGLASSISKRTESKLAVNSMQNERTANNNMVSNTIGASKKTENLTSSVPRIESKFAINSMQKGRITNNNMVSNTIGAATKRNDEMDLDRLVESNTSSIPRKNGSAAGPLAMEKERAIFPNTIGTEQRQQVEKDTDKKKEGKEKTEDKRAEDGDRNEKKRKDKDKDRHREKKKEEKKRVKGEHKHTKHDKLRENGTKDHIKTTIITSINPKLLGEDQAGSLNNKTLAPRIENTNAAGADGHNKKRKEFEMNGFLREPQHDERPNKIPRTIASSSHISMENGKPLEVINISPEKLGDVNNSKIDKGFNNNRNHINVKAEVQPSNLSRPSVPSYPPVAVDSSKSSRVQSRPPHPDTKYLNTIYSIPKVEEFPEFDDQEWLFNSEKPVSNAKAEADEPPSQVWAQGLQIESADVFALPYVIPF